MDEFEVKVRELMRGGYDLHVHAAPSHSKRAVDDFELARQLDEYGMAGAITKCHYEPTGARAAIANRYSGAKARLFGAIALNRPVGGINPYAVESALKLGAKMVWLPTKDVKAGLKVVDENGALLPQVYEVFDVVKKFGAYLATGHITPAESDTVIRAGLKEGVNMILTHPDSKSVAAPLEMQLALAKEGAMIEKTWGNVHNGHISAEAMVESIKLIGSEHVFLVTDFGQADSPMPVQGIHDFVSALLRGSIRESDIITMLRTNPARIVGEL